MYAKQGQFKKIRIYPKKEVYKRHAKPRPEAEHENVMQEGQTLIINDA